MAIYRIATQEGVVGCIVAKGKTTAKAYALGKYGASAEVVKVNTKDAVKAVGVCVLVDKGG